MSATRLAMLTTFAWSLAGCGVATSPLTTAPAPPRWNDEAQVTSGIGVALVPLSAEAKGASTLWADLFAKMADDPKSRKLLQRLAGPLPVELQVKDGRRPFDADAAHKALPSQPPAILLIVHAEQPGKETTYQADLAKIQGYDRAWVGAFGYGWIVRRRDGDPQVPKSVAEALANRDVGLEVVYLVANDYLLRHDAGWQLTFQGIGIPEGLDQMQENATKLRADIDRRIGERESRMTGDKPDPH